MNSLLPERKHARLKGYDYSQGRAYFLTICTKNRVPVLSKIVVGPEALIGPQVALTDIGEIVFRHVENIDTVYPHIVAERFVIRPNHIHLLLRFSERHSGPMRASGPTVGGVIRGVKGLTTRDLGRSIWQEKFHDHVIRDENDFLNHWSYIDSNPARWAEDEYFTDKE